MKWIERALASFLALSGCLFAMTAATAQTPASPYQLKGFRSAHFGMTTADVRAAIHKDFRVKDETIQQSVIPTGRTPVLVVHVAALFAQSGVGQVVYLFGYHSNKLMQVSVLLSTQTDPELNADRLLIDGKILQNYFLALGYPAKNMAVNKASSSGLVLFQGLDPQGRLTSLQLQGTMTKSPGGQMNLTPKQLRLDYVADPMHPDIMKSLAGQF